MLRPLRCVTLLVSVSCTLLFADQITLRNGDHLTGKIVKSDDKAVVLHTDAADDVTIKFEDIQQITTDQDLHVELKAGKTADGPVTLHDTNLEVATKTAGIVRAPISDLTLMRNETEQAAYEKSLHPGLMRGWNGGINVGFSLARGNSQTENLALAFNAVHPTVNSKIIMAASTIYTKNDLASPSIVANLDQGMIRYDRDIAPRVFVFVGAEYMANALQFLDLRQVYEGGLGVHAIKSDTTTLDFFAGLNYTHETYSNGPLLTTTPLTYKSYGVTNRFLALTLGEDFTHKIGDSTVITENFTFFPDLTSYSGQYRGQFNFGTVTKISSWLGWQNQFNDIYVSNPPTGAKKNDVIFTTGLNVAFTH